MTWVVLNASIIIKCSIMLHDNQLTKRYISLWIMKMELQHQHKKCERAGKCQRFPVFSVFYKLGGLTGPEGITVLQNPWILWPAGGNPLDIRACQEVWNIVFLGLPVLMLCFQEHPCGSTIFFRSHVSLIFLWMEALWNESSQDVLEGKFFPAWCLLLFFCFLS